jgi:hypothetical protein
LVWPFRDKYLKYCKTFLLSKGFGRLIQIAPPSPVVIFFTECKENTVISTAVPVIDPLYLAPIE